MYQRCLVVVVSSLVVLATISPSRAEVITVSSEDDDERLYLNQTTEQVGEIGGSMRAFYGHTETKPTFYVSKGKFRLTDDRFLEIISTSEAAPEFIDGVNAEISFRRNLLAGTVVSLTAFLAGIGLGTFGMSRRPMNASVAFTGLGVTVFSSIPLIALPSIYAARAQEKPFTAEQAFEAVKAYNKQLSAQEAQ